MKITIPGEPRGKQRPRFNKKTGTTYTPSETTQYEKMVKMIARATYHHEPIEGAIRVRIQSMYRIPPSASQDRKKRMQLGLILPEVKPDVDNVAKIILDALNGVVYKDDKQVVELITRKFYDTNPRVIVEVEPV